MKQFLVALLVILTLTTSCAGPQLQVPKASPISVEMERERQLDFAFRNQIEQRRRVFSVYSRLRTAGADLCKNDVAPFWGLWIVDLGAFPAEERDQARRVLKIDNNISILAAEGNATAVGLKPGDILTKIAGVTWQRQFSLVRGSELQSAMNALQKAGMRPVEFEIMRGGEKFSTVLTPKVGCRYPVTIQQNRDVNANSDGRQITIYTGVIDLASNDDELAAVLAHEMSHNVLGHTDRSKSNASVGALLGAVVDIGLAVGARVNTNGQFMKSGFNAGAKAYSQEFEREADYTSLYFMVKAGFDPTKAADMQRKFGLAVPGSMESNYASDHPSSPERAANLDLALQEVAGKVAHNEALVPTALGSESTPAPQADVNALRVLREQQAKVKQEQQTEKMVALKPVAPEKKPEPIRRVAMLTHIKGRLMSSPPVVLQAEYFEVGDGRGTSRVIYPGNYLIEGEYRTLPLNQSFSGKVNARLLNPDKLVTSSNSDLKTFARYSSPDGTAMECAFPISNSGRIEQGRCLDTRGNEYRVTSY